MRQARIKISSKEDRAVYHCISRVVDRRFIFEAGEKKKFIELMREYEEFCGVQVLTYCLMSNHFHILVEVPKRPETLPTAEEVLERLRGLSGAAISAGKAEQMLAMFAQAQNAQGAAEYLEQFYQRMWDVSEFIKLIKQRFSQWYNRQMNRKGTLWEERFKSVLVEGEGDPLGTMAAYIDLNPVRAGLVTDPAEYRWSGYGEAMSGRRRAKEGIQRIYGLTIGQMDVSRTESLQAYRVRVFAHGEAGREGTDETGQPLRRGLNRETVVQMMLKKGRIGLDEYLKCRVRYFSDGVALGSREFVDGVFQKFRDHFGGKRTTGARWMRGLEPDLFIARDLRISVFA